MSDSDPRMTPGTTPGPEWVTAVDASRAAGVTPATVRAWARDGLIESQQTQGPFGQQKMFRLDEVIKRARPDRRQKERRRSPKAVAPGDRRTAERRRQAALEAETPPAPVAPVAPKQPHQERAESDPAFYLEPLIKTIPDLMAQLTDATERAARAEVKVEFLSEQIAQLKQRVKKLSTGSSTEPARGATSPMDVNDSDAVEIDVREESPGAIEGASARLAEQIWGSEERSPSPTASPGAEPDERPTVPDGWRWPDEPQPRRRGLFRRRGRRSAR